MKIIRGWHNVPKSLNTSVVTIGNFDGVHRGHQFLIDALKKMSSADKPSVLIIFEPQPIEFFKPNDGIKRITQLQDKLRILQKTPIDYVLILAFNQALAQTEARTFIEHLNAQLMPTDILIGHDFRFGYKRQGDFDLIRQMGNALGFKAHQLGTLKSSGLRVSSTQIRHQLAKGDLQGAESLLGFPYKVTARIEKGDQMGRQLGFPTANLRLQYPTSLRGVFLVRVTLNTNLHWGLANVGIRPTLAGKKYRLEVYILDFNQDIYGQKVTVKFVRFLREEKTFESLNALKNQIAKDKENALLWLKTQAKN